MLRKFQIVCNFYRRAQFKIEQHPRFFHWNSLSLFWNFWQPGNVREFGWGQRKVGKKAQSQGKVDEFV